MKEELFENGKVIISKNGFAEVFLKEKTECEDCSAKLFCSPKDNNNRSLIVKDPIGTLPGDDVRISVNGKDVLKASIALYGIPLLLIIIAIIIGLNIFNSSSYKELYSFISGLASLALYYFILFKLTSSPEKGRVSAKIISSSRPV